MHFPEIEAFPAAVLNRGLVLLCLVFFMLTDDAPNGVQKKAGQGDDEAPEGDNERLE